MGRKNRNKAREGRVVTNCTGIRWTAQLELDERRGDRFSRLRLDVHGRFSDEASAVQAAQAVLTEWRIGGVTLRDLVLRELAGLYRRLRERRPMIEPAAVPTTRAAWERALALWSGAGLLDAADVERYREHVAHAFDASTVTVKRHGLLEVGPDSAS